MFKKLIHMSLCTLLAVQSLGADVFFEPTQEQYTNVVFLLDWDSVIADDIGGFSKFCAALGTVPTKKSLYILFRRLGHIIKTMRNARKDGQELKGVAANIDFLIEQEPSLKPYRARLMQKLNNAKPRCTMISYLQNVQQHNIKLVIATNNDYESLSIKTNKLNARLARKKLAPLNYDACFCAGSPALIVDNKTPHGIPAGTVYKGKDSDEYFEKIFAFVETEFGYNRANTVFVFVDDLEKNVTRARNVAKQENVTLCAVHRNKSDKKVIQQMKNALSGYVPSYIVAP